MVIQQKGKILKLKILIILIMPKASINKLKIGKNDDNIFNEVIIERQSCLKKKQFHLKKEHIFNIYFSRFQ